MEPKMQQKPVIQKDNDDKRCKWMNNKLHISR